MDKKRLAGLDGLRFWAIILIVAEHTGFITENGAVGVALCFVLSGFLAVYVGGENPEENFFSPMKWIRYYLQRAFRILPMYYICILYFFYFYPETCFGNWNSVIRHMTFQECGIHFWYLQQEVYMYLFLPLIMLILGLLGKFVFRGMGRNKEWVYIALLLVAAYIIKHHNFLYLLGNGSMQAFRIYLFMMGMAVGYFCRLLKSYDITLGKGAAIAGNTAGNLVILFAFLITLLSSPMFLIHAGIDIRGQYYGVAHDMLFGLVAMAWIISAVFTTRGPIKAFFENPLFVHLSERSYGIYLWHFLLRINVQVQDGYRNFIMDLFLSICVAEVLYVIVEKPIGDFGKYFSGKRFVGYYKKLFTK